MENAIISERNMQRKMWEDLQMCDVKKYTKIYNDIKKLTQDDTMQLILESPTEDEKDFYEMIGNYLLQKKQQECIANNIF